MKNEVVYVSPYKDPLINLGIENYLLEHSSAPSSILFLYENSQCVVLGRFQNPWRECRLGLAEQLAVPILRRISGGGTVVHGPGNLNFSLISAESVSEKKNNLERVCCALRTLGIPCRVNERFDLVTHPADGRDEEWYKFSGTALRQLVGRSMHHATLLVDADFQTLKPLIRPPERKIRTGAIASVRSDVINLSKVIPGLTVDSVIKALCTEWGVDVPVLLNNLSILSSDGQVDSVRKEIDKFVRMMESFEWFWGKTPPFTEIFPDWPEGLAEGSCFRIRRGIIELMSMPGADERQLERMQGLRGRPYRGREVKCGLEGAFPLRELERLSSLIEGETGKTQAGRGLSSKKPD